jgi:hypothetical protein
VKGTDPIAKPKVCARQFNIFAEIFIGDIWDIL